MLLENLKCVNGFNGIHARFGAQEVLHPRPTGCLKYYLGCTIIYQTHLKTDIISSSLQLNTACKNKKGKGKKYMGYTDSQQQKPWQQNNKIKSEMKANLF